MLPSLKLDRKLRVVDVKAEGKLIVRAEPGDTGGAGGSAVGNTDRAYIACGSGGAGGAG